MPDQAVAAAAPSAGGRSSGARTHSNPFREKKKMAGPKEGAKGRGGEIRPAEAAKDAAAAAAARRPREADDEEWVLDTTTPVVLDRRPPKT